MASIFLRQSTAIYHSGSPVVEICEGDRVLAYYHKNKDGCYITIPSAISLAEAHRAMNYLVAVQEHGHGLGLENKREEKTFIRNR